MIKRILVGLGGTPYTAAEIERSVELAKAHGAQLTGVTVFDAERLRDIGPVPMGIGASAVAEEVREERMRKAKAAIEESIAEFAAACERAGIQHETHTETGDELALLESLSRYHDLVVLGLRGIFEYGVMPAPHDALVRLISAGVRPILAVAEQHQPIQRVLVAYSGSIESAKTMKRFVQMRLWENIAMRIVVFDGAHGDAQTLLADAAGYCRAHGYDPEIDYVHETPEKHLLPYAGQWNADLIVAGNSAKSLLRRKLFGETALTLFREADRTLFLGQ